MIQVTSEIKQSTTVPCLQNGEELSSVYITKV